MTPRTCPLSLPAGAAQGSQGGGAGSHRSRHGGLGAAGTGGAQGGAKLGLQSWAACLCIPPTRCLQPCPALPGAPPHPMQIPPPCPPGPAPPAGANSPGAPAWAEAAGSGWCLGCRGGKVPRCSTAPGRSWTVLWGAKPQLGGAIPSLHSCPLAAVPGLSSPPQHNSQCQLYHTPELGACLPRAGRSLSSYPSAPHVSPSGPVYPTLGPHPRSGCISAGGWQGAG